MQIAIILGYLLQSSLSTTLDITAPLISYL
jgi:hypothetical protein